MRGEVGNKRKERDRDVKQIWKEGEERKKKEEIRREKREEKDEEEYGK